MKNIIVSRLNGGLGNQMFQYSVGRAISLCTGRELYLETGNLERDSLRESLIQNFNINCTFVNEQFLEKKMFWPIKLTRRFPKLPHPKSYTRYVREKSFFYDKSVFSIRGDICLEGYWQSPKYFQFIESELLKEFSLKKKISHYRRMISNKILNENSVSIHIRRGDYVSDPKTNSYHGTCSLEWYKNSMKFIERSISNPNYFIFSDDLDWAKQNISSNHSINYVENQNDGKDFEDLYIMSLCKHNIISNSSFSWWAAWMNKNPSKIIVHPKKWFNVTHVDTRDLIPDNWIEMP